MATYAQGTALVFNNVTFTVTNITLSFSDAENQGDKIDISHLGLSAGSNVLTMDRPLKGSATSDTGKEISFDYIGNTQLLGGTTGPLSGPISGTATVVTSSLTYAVNDVIRGSATLRVS